MHRVQCAKGKGSIFPALLFCGRTGEADSNGIYVASGIVQAWRSCVGGIK